MELGEFARARDSTAKSAEREAPSARLGFDFATLTPQLAEQLGTTVRDGIVITRVSPTHPARAAGIRPGQVILSINDQEVKAPNDVSRIAGQLRAGEVVSVRLRDPSLGETIVNYRVPG